MDDDGTGWNEVLVGGWTDAVRDASVARAGELTAGWRGPLVRTLAAEEGVEGAWTEALHRVVIRAIADVTGADLDELGSHAAWACYEEVWSALAGAWADGGDLARVPIGQEPAVTTLLRGLPAEAAAAAGADVRGPAPDPLWIGGRLRIDVVGLEEQLRRGQLSGPDELRVETLLDHVCGRRRR